MSDEERGRKLQRKRSGPTAAKKCSSFEQGLDQRIVGTAGAAVLCPHFLQVSGTIDYFLLIDASTPVAHSFPIAAQHTAIRSTPGMS